MKVKSFAALKALSVLIFTPVFLPGVISLRCWFFIKFSVDKGRHHGRSWQSGSDKMDQRLKSVRHLIYTLSLKPTSVSSYRSWIAKVVCFVNDVYVHCSSKITTQIYHITYRCTHTESERWSNKMFWNVRYTCIHISTSINYKYTYIYIRISINYTRLKFWFHT